MTNNYLLSQAQSKVVKIFTMLKVQGMTHFVFGLKDSKGLHKKSTWKGFAQLYNRKKKDVLDHL